MKKYKIQDREAGNVIETNLTLKKAEKMLKAFENQDKKDGSTFLINSNIFLTYQITNTMKATTLNGLNKNQVKSKGVIFNRENGCEMYLVIGKWNDNYNKPDYHWYMISEKTGMHMITSQSNRPESRVNEHWKGFLSNQQDK